jgi:hypothetical protein
MITEDALADLFERAVQHLDPAVHAIVTAAERRGRRLRSRRRAWLALGSGFAAATLTGTALVAGVPLGHPRSAPVPVGAASRHASAKPSGAGQWSAKPSGRSSPAVPSQLGYGPPPTLAPGYQTTAEQKLAALRRLLPAGSTFSNINPYSAQDGTLEVDYNDSRGAVDLMIDIQPTATYTDPLNCPTPLWPDEGPRPPGALPISCAMRTLPDGGLERAAVMYADVKGFYGYNIYYQRPDGITVFLQVGNGINHGWPQVDRARPPGSMAEWEAVAENPAWHLKKGWHLES